MIGVVASSLAYAVAVDGLPLRTHLADTARGAVVVLENPRDAVARATSAVESGAIGLVLASSGMLDATTLDVIAEIARGIPVVVDRPWLRADVVAAAQRSDPPRYASADIAARSGELGGVLCDALGWLRLLTGAGLVADAVERSSHGVLALLRDEESGLPVAVTASRLVGDAGARLRVDAVGEVRTEVVMDAATSARRVVVTTHEGALAVPRAHEAHERLALRRLLDAIVEGRSPADLDELRRDRDLAQQLLARG